MKLEIVVTKLSELRVIFHSFYIQVFSSLSIHVSHAFFVSLIHSDSEENVEGERRIRKRRGRFGMPRS